MPPVTSEADLVRALAAALGPAGDGVRLGIGDDCAVLARPPGELVWTVDAHVDAVHFRRTWLMYEDVGFRSYAAAASDVVAMGALPVAALSALTLDPSVSDDDVVALARGQRQASEVAAAPVVGGNLSRGATFSVTTTVLGRVLGPRAVERSGARPGDRLFLTGPVGLAGLGLRALEAGLAEDPVLRDGVDAFRRPRVRYDLASAVSRASSAVDVSDGLAIDAGRLAAASGVSVVFREADVLALGGPALLAGAARFGLDPLVCALRGGEDYVVLGTLPPDEPAHAGLVLVGEVRSGEGVLVERGGEIERVGAVGHDHFA
ncbi:MAG: thiamine-phosphate kinase [Polyangiaceae bacterium]